MKNTGNAKKSAGEALERDMGAVRACVGTLVGHYGNTLLAFDMEDLFQEGCMAYLSAYEDYDPELGASPMTWAERKIRWRIADCLRTNQARTACLEDVRGLSALRSGEPEDTCAADMDDGLYLKEVEKAVAAVYDCAGARGAKTVRIGAESIRAMLEGEEASETARRLGVSTRYLAACRKRAAEWMKPYFEKDGAMGFLAY